MTTAKICFITAIYGKYENTCKPFVSQTIPTDFICFTDNPHINSRNWIIDTTPYHILNKSPLDRDIFNNSYVNNKHTFNICKYYKQAFINIPRLKDYEVIIWLDGTLEIIYDKVSEYIMKNIYKHKIIGWHHNWRKGVLAEEVINSNFWRYTSTFWNNQVQTYQNVNKQYEEYLKDGYNDEYFKKLNSHTPHMGVWLTCFVAFLKNDTEVINFLDLWYLQTLKYTTQDQIGFPYVVQKTHLIPLTLPNNEVYGEDIEKITMFYVKHNHGK